MRQLLDLLTGTKTTEGLKLGIVLLPVVAVIEKYLFNDWEFLGFLCVLVVVDTALGVQRRWVCRTISSRGFSRLFTKAGLYLALLVLTHVMSRFPIHGEANVLFQWFDAFMYSCMMAREALSILEHVATIEPRLVPKALLKRLALISEEGPVAALTPPAPPAPIPPQPE